MELVGAGTIYQSLYGDRGVRCAASGAAWLRTEPLVLQQPPESTAL